ncbi:cutinase family protein [Nocardia vaccinii]|uniref:cutinase family protein n=1 Tax=Nocardia vaccinii TaxID=1822 RepID=UPI000835AE47|nr:cutinase family protein [Nocardia vaccinii]
MSSREFWARKRTFVVRHRITAAVAAPAILGTAVAVAVAVLPDAGPRTATPRLIASVTDCHDMVTISVAGRNDSPSAATTKLLVGADGKELPAALSDDYHSQWVDPVVNAPNGKVDPGSYAAVYISYPANMNSYEDAVNAGVANTEQVMEQIKQACPATKFAIVGYSEGADVVRRVAMQVGHQEPAKDGSYAIVDPASVTGVVILADSGRSAGDGPFPGAQNPYSNPDGFDQKYQNGTTPISGQGALPDNSGDFGSLDGKVASFCSEGDLTCAAPQNISLLQLAANVGRQLNVDKLQADGLTPATGQDVATVLARIGYNAFEYIRSQPNWMAGEETLLQVLLKVSEPGYKPGQQQADPAPAQSISTDELAPLAYLPQKVFNEVVGLIVTNQNTIPVILSDPYQLTLGPNGTGHHFDYWRDSSTADGKPLTSAEYAAAWLTHLAQQAQAGKQIDTTSKPDSTDVAAAYKAAAETRAASTTTAIPTTTTSPTTTSAAPATTVAPATTTTPTRTTTTVSPAPATTEPKAAEVARTPRTPAPTAASSAETSSATTTPERTTTAAPTTPPKEPATAGAH